MNNPTTVAIAAANLTVFEAERAGVDTFVFILPAA
jgi:hypothetical protein